jgi:hypothetical protein
VDAVVFDVVVGGCGQTAVDVHSPGLDFGR